MAYTARKIMEAVLTELNKVNAPSVLLDDFNYFFNKAIQQFVNKQYNIYDVNQQTTDNMRVLKAGALLKPHKAYEYADFEGGASGVVGDDVKMIDSVYGATYEVDLPDDYFHLLNCVCIYKLKKRDGCHNAGDYWSVAAQRLTADLWAGILNNLYARPLPRRPYYYIHNVNTSVDRPTNPIELDDDGQIIKGTDVTPNTTYVFLLDKFTNEFEAAGGQLPVTVTSTKKINNESPAIQGYTYKVRNADWLDFDGTNVIANDNTTPNLRYGYIDFTQNESNNTLTFTAIQKGATQYTPGGYIYTGKNEIPAMEIDITDPTNNRLFVTSSKYRFNLDGAQTKVVWFAFKTNDFNVTTITEKTFNTELWGQTNHSGWRSITVGEYTVVYYGDSTVGAYQNNSYEVVVTKV